MSRLDPRPLSVILDEGAVSDTALQLPARPWTPSRDLPTIHALGHSIKMSGDRLISISSRLASSPAWRSARLLNRKCPTLPRLTAKLRDATVNHLILPSRVEHLRPVLQATTLLINLGASVRNCAFLLFVVSRACERSALLLSCVDSLAPTVVTVSLICARLVVAAR